MTTLKNGYLLYDRYRILDILGEGVRGVVYRAVDEKLDISVVVKERIYRPEEEYQQFQQAARVLAALRHPNISGLFDYFFIEDQGQYLVCEYIDGADLQQWMQKTEGPTEMDGLQIGIAICNALTYLHSQDPPILHCGIKPDAIKFSAFGEIILVDFGVFNSVSIGHIELSPYLKLEPEFLPPEQFGGAGLDQRSDVFSLGATLYAALAGYPPENSLDRATGKSQLSSLRGYQPHLSRLTVSVIEKSLNLHYEDRWQSAAEMKAALIVARDALPTEKRQDTSLPDLDQISTTAKPSRRTTRKEDLNWIERIKARKWLSQRDPVWVFYGVIILLLGVLFGLTLIRPQGMQRLFTVAEQPIPTQVDLGCPECSDGNPVNALEQDTQPPTAPVKEEIIAMATEPGVNPVSTPKGGGLGQLAFVSDRSGIPQVFLVDILSGEIKQLTELDDGACQPDWSPTGEKIVFTSPCPGKKDSYPGSRLLIIDIESGELTALPASLEGDFDPVWSPDGEWIAYTTLINGCAQLAKLQLSDLTSTRLTESRYPDSSPAWSPNGEQLAFVRTRNVPQIWVIDANGQNQRQFTRSGSIDNTNPAWYTDGNIILFSQSFGEGSALKQIHGMRFEDLGQDKEYPIIPRMHLDYIPLMDHVDVSPDGYWLAFDHWYFDILSDIYIMAFPGGNLIQLTEYPGLDYDPVWSP